VRRAEKAGRRTRKAIAKAEKYVAYSQRHYGAGDRKTLNARGHLADAYHEAGRTGEAIAMLEQIAADSEGIFGPDHEETLFCLSRATAPRRRSRSAAAVLGS